MTNVKSGNVHHFHFFVAFEDVFLYNSLMTKQFTKVDEDFICEMCGAHVHGNGYTNHCPECLTSKHVDIMPGDRACECAGLMPAVGLETKNGEFVLVQKCQKCGTIVRTHYARTKNCPKCGHMRRNKIWENDNRKALRALSAGNLTSYIKSIKK